MADRTAVGIFAEVFTVLASRENQEEARAIAHELWPMTQSYDFCDEQMDCDEELKVLGLLREAPHPKYMDETLKIYGPVD